MVSDQVYLTQWVVKEVESDGSIHFIGFDIKSRQVVVSPCIISFLNKTRLGVTRNEVKYTLIGEPGISVSADEVWKAWCDERRVPIGVDITNEYVGIR